MPETTEQKKLLRLQARRRGHLKAAVKRYAKVFNMSYWFQVQEDAIFSHTLAGASLVFAHTYSGWLDQKIKETPLNRFEECGTTCCLAGLDYKRSGRSVKEQSLFYGLNWDVYQPTQWPYYLRMHYNTAKQANDFNGMADAACLAIDHFAVK